MTKLTQLLCFLTTFGAVWLALITETVPIEYSDSLREVILMSPIYFLMTFACYSLAVIGYRVTTFNDCVDASEELQQHIREARQDLQSKGYNFNS